MSLQINNNSNINQPCCSKDYLHSTPDSLITTLPTEILLKIFDQLSIHDIPNFAMTCKAFRHFTIREITHKSELIISDALIKFHQQLDDLNVEDYEYDNISQALLRIDIILKGRLIASESLKEIKATYTEIVKNLLILPRMYDDLFKVPFFSQIIHSLVFKLHHIWENNISSGLGPPPFEKKYLPSISSDLFAISRPQIDDSVLNFILLSDQSSRHISPWENLHLNLYQNLFESATVQISPGFESFSVINNLVSDEAIEPFNAALQTFIDNLDPVQVLLQRRSLLSRIAGRFRNLFKRRGA